MLNKKTIAHNIKISTVTRAMQLGEISFCDKVGFNIKSDEFKKKVLQELESLYNFRVIQKHYDRYDESLVPVLTNNPHMISLRSNGNPYLLYLTRHNGVNQCIFIDKKIQHGYFYPRMIIARFWFHDELFNNTLFDGEMVKQENGRWLFIINDMVADSGYVLSNTNLVKRINRIHHILETQYMVDELDVCAICVKRYFHYHEYDTMVGEFRNSLPYSSRGVYFKPLFIKFRNILYNFDDTLIKKVIRTRYKDISTFMLNKEEATPPPAAASLAKPSGLPPPQQQPHAQTPPAAEGTRVLCVQKTSQPDIYDVSDPAAGTQMGIACVNNIRTSKLLREIFRNTTPTEKVRMECEYSEKFAKWVPLRAESKN